MTVARQRASARPPGKDCGSGRGILLKTARTPDTQTGGGVVSARPNQRSTVSRRVARALLLGVLALALVAHVLVMQQPVFIDEFRILGNFWDFVGGRTIIPEHTAYPTLFSYLAAPFNAAFAAMLVARGGPPAAEDLSEWYAYCPEMGMFPARLLSLLCWAIFVWATGRMGREMLGGSTRALLAAGTAAAAIGPLKYSGYGLPDVAMMMFGALSLLHALRLARGERWRRSALLAGLLTGLAVATKYTALALVVALLAAMLAMPVKAHRWPAVLRMAGMALSGFIIGCPGWLLAPAHFWQGFAAERAHMALGHLGYLGVPLLGQLELLLTADPLLIVLAIAGAIVLARGRRRHRTELAVLGALIGAVLLMAAPAKKQSLQYLFALYPALALLAAGCAVPMGRRGLRALVPLAMGLLVAAGWGLAWSARVAVVPDSLQVARQWINANLPDGAVVAVDWIDVPRLVEQADLESLRADLRTDLVRDAYAGLRGFPSVPIVYDEEFLRTTDAEWFVTSSTCYARFFEFGRFTRRPPPAGSRLRAEFDRKRALYQALQDGRYGWGLVYEMDTGNGPRVRIYRRGGA